jgi:hypothetical protein
MDWLPILIIIGLGGIVIAIALVMLNRAWGDFPGRIGVPPQPPTVGRQSPWPAPEDDFADYDLPDAAIPDAGPPTTGMIPLQHPLVRQAALQAIERGGFDNPYTQYLFRRGDEVLLNLDAISDPEQRARVAQVVYATNHGGEVGLSMIEIFRALNQLGRRP